MPQRREDGTRGMAAIEFALLLPLFLVLVFGLIEFAQVLFFQAALQHAVTNAARCASEFSTTNAIGPTNTPPDCSTSDNIVTVAVQQAYGLQIPASTFSTSLSATTNNNYNCVYASYPFNFTIPLMPAFALTLTANSCFPAAPSSTQ